jgi:hypothetical protein
MGRSHVDSDVEAALLVREELVDRALDHLRANPEVVKFKGAFEEMRRSRIYVWEPPALEAFEKFWKNKENDKKFRQQCFDGKALTYKENLVGDEIHVFPAPGKLIDGVEVPPKFRVPGASVLFPPTTRGVGISSSRQGIDYFLPAVILTVHADPEILALNGGGLRRVEPIRTLPQYGTADAKRLMSTAETRFPRVIAGNVTDWRPIAWLTYLYKLQIFLMQPFVGAVRKRSKGKKKRKYDPEPPAEIVQVLLREPLPRRIPRYIVPGFHPITGRKLEFEVDVKAHMRHCASGIVVPVTAHKRGPLGKTRVKVIKVIR